ncbi:unnamed protein product [Owenia fusiformis]|uniref:DDE Tnp4 domain-containing protein n=1 Tax=Owenia fusiformis TaxID=6347 RepID=A0A8S4NPA4_OWEFU|nr:unnamed protein product [Owenia fusiformis]
MAASKLAQILFLEEFMESLSSSSESPDSSDDEEIVMLMAILRRDIPKVITFCEIVNRFDKLEFRRHFRIERESYNELCRRLEPHLSAWHVQAGEGGRGRRQRLSTEKKVLIGLWYFANKETIRSLAIKLGVANLKVHDIIQEFVASVMIIKDEVIHWPSQDDMNEADEAFRAFRGIPGIIGATDGTHTPIPKPSGTGADYINRKGFFHVTSSFLAMQHIPYLRSLSHLIGTLAI